MIGTHLYTVKYDQDKQYLLVSIYRLIVDITEPEQLMKTKAKYTRHLTTVQFYFISFYFIYLFGMLCDQAFFYFICTLFECPFNKLDLL